MPLRYEEYTRLSNGHAKGITCVAFSPNGLLLASGALDGRVCIWSLKTNALLHVVSGSSAVLSISWQPLCDDLLLCGLQDGAVAVINITFVQCYCSLIPYLSLPLSFSCTSW